MRLLAYRVPPRNLTRQERVIRSTLGLAGITLASMHWHAWAGAGHGTVALLAWQRRPIAWVRFTRCSRQRA